MRRSHQPDRRQARRYHVVVPVEFETGTGITRDVSEVGVLFETTTMMHLGEVIEFALLLGQFDPAGNYRVRCSGAVVRVDETNDAYAVAVQLHSYSL